MAAFVQTLQQQGFALLRNFSAPAEIEELKEAFAEAPIARAQRNGETFGARNILELDAVKRIATSPALMPFLSPLIGPHYRAVRGIFFDKTQGANWPVPWHQDLSVAVKERRELPGWENWSVKRGVTHVQPPPEILARMVTMRLHLDDCPAENGALRVIPGSHRCGPVARAHMDGIGEAETVTAMAGDALFMRPLILHASSSAQKPGHRRVLHLELRRRISCRADWSGRQRDFCCMPCCAVSV